MVFTSQKRSHTSQTSMSAPALPWKPNIQGPPHFLPAAERHGGFLVYRLSEGMTRFTPALIAASINCFEGSLASTAILRIMMYRHRKASLRASSGSESGTLITFRVLEKVALDDSREMTVMLNSGLRRELRGCRNSNLQ